MSNLQMDHDGVNNDDFGDDAAEHRDNWLNDLIAHGPPPPPLEDVVLGKRSREGDEADDQEPARKLANTADRGGARKKSRKHSKRGKRQASRIRKSQRKPHTRKHRGRRGTKRRKHKGHRGTKRR